MATFNFCGLLVFSLLGALLVVVSVLRAISNIREARNLKRQQMDASEARRISESVVAANQLNISIYLPRIENSIKLAAERGQNCVEIFNTRTAHAPGEREAIIEYFKAKGYRYTCSPAGERGNRHVLGW